MNNIWYVLIDRSFYIIIPLSLFVTVNAYFTIIIATFIHKPKLKGWMATIVAFSCLGAFTGFFVGASMTPVVGVILPAVLTFLTALVAYLLGTEQLVDWRPIIPLCIIVMLLSAFYGTFMGINERDRNEEYIKRKRERTLYYEKVCLEIEKEKYIRILRGEKVNLLPISCPQPFQLEN